MARETEPARFQLNVDVEPGSVQAAFLRRSISALERIVGSAPTKELTAALAAPTDVGSLARLLGRSEVVGSAVTDLDPLAPAMARNIEHRRHLVKMAGGTMSADEAGRMLGITRQAVDKRRRSYSLLAFREAGDWRYPACQFDQGEAVTGIADVVRGFSEAGPWAALDFLLAPDSALGGMTPMEGLHRGKREAVLRLLRAQRGDGFA
jgi:hypothetical protein